METDKINSMFIACCGKGVLTTAKELFEMYPSINIHADNEDAFISACSNGHLEVAKWL